MPDGFTVRVADLSFRGSDLQRPECVLVTARGDLFVSDRRGGVLHIQADGQQRLVGSGTGLLPNGIALRQDGSFLVANLHSPGGVWEISRNGQARPFLMEVDGMPLAAVNFVRLDAGGRVWICANPPLSADGRYRTEKAEGCIVVVDGSGARIATDSIAWANECLVHPNGRHLFVNETFGRRLTRFDIGPGAALSNRLVHSQFGYGTYPDGLALDEEDGIWVVGVAANRLIRVAPDGRPHVVLEDSDAAHLEALEQAYLRHSLTRELLVTPTNTTLRSLSSIAFGGADRRTVFLGAIADTRLASFRSPLVGHAPIHWTW
jgi:sugar lactone lactonase YvrE